MRNETYKIKLTPTSKENLPAVKKVFNNLKDNHLLNYKNIGDLVDDGKCIVERDLTEDENLKIYDFKISGRFDEAEDFEIKAKLQWEFNFIKLLK